MHGFMPKGVNVKAKQKSLVSQEAPVPKPVLDVLPPDFQGKPDNVLGQMEAYFRGITEGKEDFFVGVSEEEIESLLKKAEAVGMSIARLRLNLGKKLGKSLLPPSSSDEPDSQDEKKTSSPASRRKEFKRLLTKALEMATAEDQLLAEQFGSAHMDVAGLSLFLEEALDKLKKMMYACNRVRDGRM